MLKVVVFNEPNIQYDPYLRRTDGRVDLIFYTIKQIQK